MGASGTNAVQCWCGWWEQVGLVQCRLVGARQEEGTCCGGGPHSQGCLPCQPGFYPTLAPPHRSTGRAFPASRHESSPAHQFNIIPESPAAVWCWLALVFLKETCGRDPRRGDAGGTGRLGAQTGRQSAVAWRHNNGSSVTPQQRQERCAVQLGAGRAALYSKLLQHIHYPRWRDWTGAARRPTAHSLQLIRRAHTNNNLVSPPSGRLAKHILLAHSPKP